MEQDSFRLDGPADIHPLRRDALGFGHDCDLMDADKRRAGLLADREGVSQVVSVVVRDDDQVRLCDGIRAAAGRRVPGEKGVDVYGFRSLDLDRRMP